MEGDLKRSEDNVFDEPFFGICHGFSMAYRSKKLSILNHPRIFDWRAKDGELVEEKDN